MNMRRFIAAPRRLRWALGLLAFLALSAHAQQGGPIIAQNLFFNQASGAHAGNYLDAQAGLIYSDNVTLSPGGTGDTLAMIGLVGDTARMGAPRLDYHVNADLSLVKYLQNSYDTQPFGYADADADVKLVPGLFSWLGRASYTQALLDPSLPATPDNLESLTYLSTGPQFTFRPTLQTTVTLGGVYSYVVTDSKSIRYVDIDSSRYGGNAKISRAFTNTFSAYISGSFDRVKFKDDVTNTNFDSTQALVGVLYTTRRTSLNARVGYAKLELYPDPSKAAEITNTKPGGSTWSLDMSHLLTPTQRLDLHATKEITDAANLFRLNLDNPVPVTQQNQFLTDEPVTHRAYGGSWRVEGVRSTLQLGAEVSSDRYQITTASNRDAEIYSGFLTRQLNAAFVWELGASYEHDKYANGGTIKTTTALTTVRWQVGPRVALRFFYAYTGISPNSVSGNQVGVTFLYALTEAAKAQDTFRVPMTPNSVDSGSQL